MICPCGFGPAYDECCGPVHEGGPAATAEALMRSRYAAFALDNRDYVLASWHPETRPDDLTPDPDLRWTGLEVIAARGGLFDAEGEVEFRAHYRDGDGMGGLHERSRFVRHEGRWVYWGESS